jgi:hypothetical protein
MNIKLTTLLAMIVASTAATVTPLNAAQTDLLAAEKVVNSASEELKKNVINLLKLSGSISANHIK